MNRSNECVLRARRVALWPLWGRNQLWEKSFRQWPVVGKRFAAPSCELQFMGRVIDCSKEWGAASPWDRRNLLGTRGNQAEVAAAEYLYLYPWKARTNLPGHRNQQESWGRNPWGFFPLHELSLSIIHFKINKNEALLLCLSSTYLTAVTD